MTGTHPTSDELDRFAAATLSPDVLEQVDEHVHSCAACRETLSGGLSPTSSGFLVAVGMESDRHLTYDEIAETVDGRDPVRRDPFVREHLDRCESCRKEIEDLRAFDALATPVAAATWSARPSLLAKVRSMFHPPAGEVPQPAQSGTGTALAMRRGQLGWIAAAAAAVVVLALLPQFGGQSEPGGGAAASLLGATRALAENPESRLSEERIARLRGILDGTAPDRRPGVLSVDALSPTDQDLWQWAQTRFAENPVLLGALAEDLGLFSEARAAYQRALAAQPDSRDVRRLLENLK